jgi:hypothetical protein
VSGEGDIGFVESWVDLDVYYCAKLGEVLVQTRNVVVLGRN